MKPLVSIIIPVFNRAELIGQTLDSIIAQAWDHWECIVVDDTSTDDTVKVVGKYTQSDPRIKLFTRPAHLKKGANNCRNFGFKQSTGDFLLWFDSDDLMQPEKIQLQMDALLQKPTADFCVDRFDNFTKLPETTPEWAFNANSQNSITFQNYMTRRIFWGTINFLGKRALFDGAKFHEDLKSGQEFYFFASVMSNHPRASGVYIGRPLCLRRIHKESIQQRQKGLKTQRLENKFMVYWTVYNDFRNKIDAKCARFILRSAVVFYHKLLLCGKKIVPVSRICREIFSNFGLQKGLQAMPILLIGCYFRKGDRRGSGILDKKLS